MGGFQEKKIIAYLEKYIDLKSYLNIKELAQFMEISHNPIDNPRIQDAILVGSISGFLLFFS